MIHALRRSMAVLLVLTAGACSTAETRPAPPPIGVAEVEHVWLEKEGDDLVAHARVRYMDANTRQLAVSLEEGAERFWENRSAPQDVPIASVPSVRLPADWHFRTLTVGESLARLGEAGSFEAPLTLDEAERAVFVEVHEAEKWTVVLHVPPAAGRVLVGGAFELSPSLARTLEVPPIVLPRSGPPSEGSTGASSAEALSGGIRDFLGGIVSFVGVTVIVALLVVTFPIWLPILLGGGFRGMFSCGRPFRGAGGRACTAAVAHGPEWLASTTPSVSGLSAEDRDELSRSWLVEAKAEHASIAAFSALSLDLMAVGAPPRLLERAHRAALDEIVHARVCFALASAYCGEELTPGSFPEARSARRFSTVEKEIARLAAESLADGCLIEGFAAALAVESERTATDPAVKAALTVIARDEARHVALAWSIVEWGLAHGAHAAVARALRELPEGPSLASVVSDREVLVAHGRHGEEKLREVFLRTRAAVVERANALLACGVAA